MTGAMTSDGLPKNHEVLTRLLDNGLEKKLYSYLNRCGVLGQDAKDTVQDVFVWCLTCPEDLSKIRNPVSYIGRHAYWRVRDQNRQNWRATPLDGAPEPSVRPFLLATDLNCALSLLNEEDRELIKQHGLEGWSYGELEKFTGISRVNLHARVRRILRRMRMYLEKSALTQADRDGGDHQAPIHRKTVQSDVQKPS